MEHVAKNGFIEKAKRLLKLLIKLLSCLKLALNELQIIKNLIFYFTTLNFHELLIVPVRFIRFKGVLLKQLETVQDALSRFANNTLVRSERA